MNREQMIAWLTIEGWSYWYQPADADDGTLMAADWLRKDGLDLIYTLERDAFIKHNAGKTEASAQKRNTSELMTADIAAVVAYIQEHNL